MNTKRKVLIVDDHPVVREGLTLRVNRQSDLVVCGEAQNAAETLKLVVQEQPDIVLVDLMLKEGSGLDLIRDIASRHHGLPVLVLSVQDERMYAPRALQAGAKGYIMKNEVTEKVVDAIRHVLDGHVYLSSQMRARFLDGLAKGTTPAADPPQVRFSDRELQVYQLLGAGLGTREIAAQLHLSTNTIETYYERIKLRLGLQTRDELLRHATLWNHEQHGS